jgi:Uma2 family endonuclease
VLASLPVTSVPRRLPLDHRVDAAEYARLWDQMVDDGTISREARLELIDGEIYEMPTIGPPHNYGVVALTQILILRLVGRAVVSAQGPMDCGRWSQPLPDITVAKPPLERYADHVATGPEVLLAIEVADSTLRFDRKKKVPMYARTGVPEMWLVDVRNRQVEVYTEPHDLGYGSKVVNKVGEVLVPTAFPDLEIPVTELFPVG